MGYVGKKPTDAPLTSSDIGDGQVTAAKLGTDAVETAKVKDLNVTVAKLPATVDVSSKTVTLPASVGGLGTGITNAQLAGSIDVTAKITGTVPTGNLGSGTASSSTVLYGDQTYKAEPTTDLTPVNQDILTLALRNSIDNNTAKYNLPSSAITHFESDADYDSGGSTNITRNASEYISSVGSTYTTYTSSSGNFTVPAGVTSVEVLVVAGGGGGCASDNPSDSGGGGGGGGVVHHSALSTTPAGTIAYAVGAGGTAGSESPRDGGDGGDSTFGSITADGGGNGGADAGGDGGSGGGSGRDNTSPGTATQGDSGGGTGYGFAGGNGGAESSNTSSGGGGGAGSVGGDSSATSIGGAGGSGRLFSNFTSYGVSGYFAGGGGGGGANTPGAAGSGGGGIGGDNSAGGDGTANTGGGGGGAQTANDGGAGGSGFIGLLYTPFTSSATGTALGTTNVPTSAVTDVSGVILLKDAYGTTTLGTDVKAYFTADNSNWTEADSYTDAGTFSTGIKMIQLGKTTCTEGSDVRWKIVWANQSASSKEAYIYGIGLNY